jgi:chromosome segregation ATPase
LFVQLNNFQRTVDFYVNATNTIARKALELRNEFDLITTHLRDLSGELEDRRTAFFRIFKRSEALIQRDITETHARQNKLVIEIEAAKLKYDKAKTQLEIARNDRDQLSIKLKEFDRSVAKRMVADADTCRAPLIAEHREIESKIADLQTTVVKDAKSPRSNLYQSIPNNKGNWPVRHRDHRRSVHGASANTLDCGRANEGAPCGVWRFSPTPPNRSDIATGHL